ncbi:hypothetical protein D3C73_1241980 [compost metagenome]
MGGGWVIGDTDVTDNAHPGRVSGDDEHRHAFIHRYAFIGDRHHDVERCVAGIGGKPFFAAQQPVIAIAHRFGGEHGGIRATLRLGHGEAGHDIAIEQRLQVALLLRRGAVMGEDFPVA